MAGNGPLLMGCSVRYQTSRKQNYVRLKCSKKVM